MVIDYKDNKPVLRFIKNNVEITISFADSIKRDVKNDVLKILLSQNEEPEKKTKKSYTKA